MVAAVPNGQRNRSCRRRPWPGAFLSVARVSSRSPGRADGGGPGTAPRSAYALVSGVCLGRRRAVCKTVGSAYDGSNPSPATTCGNGPLAANSRARRAVLLVPACVISYRRGPSCCGVHGRIADGVRCVWTVGVHRRLSTDGHGRAALAACSGLTYGAEPGVHRHPSRGGLRDRDACRAAGAGAGARAFAAGEFGLAACAGMSRSCWCELFSDSAWHGQSSAEGEMVMVAVDNGLDRRADRRLRAASRACRPRADYPVMGGDRGSTRTATIGVVQLWQVNA